MYITLKERKTYVLLIPEYAVLRELWKLLNLLVRINSAAEPHIDVIHTSSNLRGECTFYKDTKYAKLNFGEMCMRKCPTDGMVQQVNTQSLVSTSYSFNTEQNINDTVRQ